MKRTATLLVETSDQLTPHAVTLVCTIGRDPRSGIPIDHPTVSRAHAQITYTESDGGSWIFTDLGSQNGSTLHGTRIVSEIPLVDGCELQIGRVRAWFFSGDVPEGWQPSDSAQLGGKLIRCRCGHIGWAPGHSAGMRLPCAKCGRDIVVSGNDIPPSPAPMNVESQTCAACHTSILTGEALHACPECAATMHRDCWRENHGCATYGCTQVQLDDLVNDANPIVDNREPIVAEPGTETVAPPAHLTRPNWLPSLAEIAVITLVGLPTFGVPGIALGAYRLVAGDRRNDGPRRLAWIALGFAAGAVGFTTSAYWWIER